VKVGAKNEQVLNALKMLESSLKDKCKNQELGYEAQKMLEGLQKSSPLALWATTMLMLKCWKMQHTRFGKYDSQHKNSDTYLEELACQDPSQRKDFLPTTFLKMEYRVLMWLMERGDYWDRVRSKAFSKGGMPEELQTSKPLTIADLDHFLKETETGKRWIREFEEVLNYPTLVGKQTKSMGDRYDYTNGSKPIGEILGNLQINDLELPHIPLRDTLVHPEFTLPGLTWKGTQHYEEQLKEQLKFHYDYAQLRGPSHPDMDLILHRRDNAWRKRLIQQGVNKFESYLPVANDVGRAQSSYQY